MLKHVHVHKECAAGDQQQGDETWNGEPYINKNGIRCQYLYIMLSQKMACSLSLDLLSFLLSVIC